MRTANLVTEPFTCPSCINKIENTLGKEEGVESVKVMFNSNKVKVTFDENVVTPETLAATVNKLGYPVLKTTVS
ncbi:MAG: heavy-metal-associated domain-containing protein [Microbacteriaceae bacterium]